MAECFNCPEPATHTCMCQDVKTCLSCIGLHIASAPAMIHTTMPLTLSELSRVYAKDTITKIERIAADDDEFRSNQRVLLNILESIQSKVQTKVAEIEAQVLSEDLTDLLTAIKGKLAAKLRAKAKVLSQNLADIKEKLVLGRKCQDDHWAYIIRNMQSFREEQIASCVDIKTNRTLASCFSESVQSFTVETKCDFSGLVETQQFIYEPKAYSKQVEVYDIATATSKVVSFDQAIPFSSACCSFLLPDNSVVVVGSAVSNAQVQRVYPWRDEVKQYSGLPSTNQFVFAYAKGLIFALNATLNYSLDLATDEWRPIQQFEAGFTPVSCGACQSQICALGTRGRQEVGIYRYPFDIHKWKLLNLTVQVGITAMVLGVDNSLIFVQDDSCIVLTDDAVERRPVVVPRGDIKSTVNSYKSHIRCFVIKNTQPAKSSPFGHSLFSQTSVSRSLCSLSKALILGR